MFGAWYYCRLRPEDAWVNPQVHRLLCNWFQQHVEMWHEQRSNITDRMVLLLPIPRGYGKSTTITAAGGLWMHTRWVNLSSGIGSYKLEKAVDFLGVIKAIMEGRQESGGMFADLHGIWKPSDAKKWTETEVRHAARVIQEIREPSFECVSTTGGAAGSRYDVYLLDDPIRDKPEDLENECERAVSHVRRVWPVIKPNGLWIVPLTRKADFDVAAWFLKKKRVRCFAPTGMKPKINQYLTDEDQLAETFDECAKSKSKANVHVFFMAARDEFGDPTLPNVWSDEALKNYQRDDPENYASEMLNDPAVGRHARITRDQIARMWVDRGNVPNNVKHLLHLDMAFKYPDRVAKGCESVIGHSVHDKAGTGDVYLMGAKTSQVWTSDEFYDELIVTLQDLLMKRLHVAGITHDRETGGLEGLLAGHLRTRCADAGIPMPRLIPLNRTDKPKAARVGAFLDHASAGQVYLVRGGENLEAKLVEQMVRYKFIQLKDVVDSYSDTIDPEVYNPRRSEVQLPDDARAERPMGAYLQVPVHQMRSEEKAHYMRQRRAEAAAANERRANLPWWHQR